MNQPSERARTSWRDFAEALPPLAPAETRFFWIAAVVIGLSRWFALSRSLWDWDEVLFSLGMRDFDVASHHPHPPGFPLFIATARLLRFATTSDFRALQGVNLLFACLLFPAVFLLARELRFRFVTAVTAGALCAFFPNVWFFGGTAFSDVPSIALVVLACAFLLRGCRSDGAFLLGTFLLAISVGYRPQNFLIGLAPGLLCSWFRFRAGRLRVVFLGAVMGAAIVGGTFWGAAKATGSWEAYSQAIEGHRQYITKVDSFRNPDRMPLYRLFSDFFVRNYQSAKIGNIVTLFVIISVLNSIYRKRINIILLILTFAPFCITAWLVLDHFSISRFSIGYAPLFALLIADGLAVSAATVSARIPVSSSRLESLSGAALVLTFAIWTLPAIVVARSTVSPPMRAIQWIRQTLNPNRVRLYVAFGMLPYAQYYLPEFDLQSIMDERGVPVEPDGSKPSYLLVEGLTANPKGINFSRGRERLWKIARRRYFEVSVAPTSHSVRFLDGWYESENAGAEVWRWMAGRAVTVLPALPGPAQLRLDLQIPLDSLPSTPTISIFIDGKLIDRFRAEEAFVTRTHRIEPSTGARTRELVIETDTVVNPAKQGLAPDERDLGLLLRSMSWGESGS